MNVTIHPGRLTGAVRAPVSKSMAHRALICAALTLLLRPLAYAILVGKKRRVATRHREVKSF